MQTPELISALILLGVIATIYTLEGSLFLRFFASKLGNKPPKMTLLSKPAVVLHCLASLGVLCFLYGYFIEPYLVEVKTVDIFTGKLKETSLKVVQISDLHCDKKIRNEYKLVKIINSLEPDIVVFTGDALNTQEALPVFKNTLRTLNAKLGKYAVQGNFDAWYFNGLDLFSGTGFQELDKASVRLSKNGESFYISGAGCQYEDFYRDALRNIPDNYFNIFLYHYPDLIEDLKGLNVDLYLAGHTHGGQVAIPFYGALVTFSRFGKKYESGEHLVGNTILSVNRGIGMEGGTAPRIRFFARPEITIFDIKPRN